MNSKQSRQRPTARVDTQKWHQAIMLEQTKLLQAKSELKKLIATVNGHLNALKVEELQLRANLVKTEMQSSQSELQPILSATAHDFDTNAEIINQQDLDLDVLLANVFASDEDEEDD
ncbi:unnamed protein product [Hermetia illucens]|uniref:Uncharacterized protein n=1 Tax=Hermetia illucens TaxID=343691 RepID=A0A7R8Z4D1_HERIL|nr:uncharacterized protein LOC119659240 [Hermetia illucens]CAD7092882.1 unnamed protein product [Hermetia illucens]